LEIVLSKSFSRRKLVALNKDVVSFVAPKDGCFPVE